MGTQFMHVSISSPSQDEQLNRAKFAALDRQRVRKERASKEEEEKLKVRMCMYTSCVLTKNDDILQVWKKERKELAEKEEAAIAEREAIIAKQNAEKQALIYAAEKAEREKEEAEEKRKMQAVAARRRESLKRQEAEEKMKKSLRESEALKGRLRRESHEIV